MSVDSYDLVSGLSSDVLREFANFTLGKKLGGGMSREVFVNRADPNTIIKVENSGIHNQNTMEWLIWEQFKHVKSIAKWLCPCHTSSYNGTFLIMDYARDMLPDEKPKKVPEFISDVKLENFGILNGKPVLRDYGTITLALHDKLKAWPNYPE